jgi:MFS family permease
VTDPAPQPDARWGDLFRDGRGVYTVLINLGVSLHAMDIFVIATVMPVVVADIGGVAFYTWTTMLYTMGTIVGGASGAAVRGFLGGRYGYVVGGLMFLAGMIGCALTPSMTALLVARAVQGTGGGLVISQSMAFIRERFPGRLRPRALSIISTTFSVASLLGPLLGGGFGELDWWRGAFWATTPLTAAFVLASLKVIPIGNRSGAFQVPGLRLAVLALSVTCIGLSSQIGDVPEKAVLVVAALVLVWFTVRLDGSQKHRIFPTGVLSMRAPIGAAFWVQSLIFVTVTTTQTFMPLVLNGVYGVTPLWIGGVTTIFSFGWTAGSLGIAGASPKLQQASMAGGMAISAVALAVLAATVGDLSTEMVCALFFVVGLGIGMTINTVTDWLLSHPPKDEATITAAAVPVMRSLGIVLGSGFAAVLANAAGLGEGVSAPTIIHAVTWIWSASVLAPLAATYCAWRVSSSIR